MYRDGTGCGVDHVKAVEWMERAGRRGLAVAQRYAALMHRDGHGTPQDESKALSWYWKVNVHRKSVFIAIVLDDY
jgi:TPR repeat protein